MMSTGDATAAPTRSAQDTASATLHLGPFPIRLSIWLPLVIFGLTRIYGLAIIALASRRQVALPSPDHPGIYQFTARPASPGYLGLITNWDGQWYERIATLGYHLPGASDPGAADTLHTFAFLPAFPTAVGALMALTGLSFAVCASALNLAAGGGALVVMFALTERTAGRFAAATAVLFTSCFVAAPLFQAAYSESISLLLVCSSLLLIAQRRYCWAVAVVLLLSLTRLVTPPLAVVVIVHAVVRYRGRAKDPVSRGEAVWLAVLTVVSAASVTLWSSITSVITSGVDTGASRGSFTTAVGAARFGWFTNAYEHISWIGVVGLGVLAVLLVMLACSPLTRTWGLEVRTWFSIYPIFLLFTAGVHTGMLRYLLLAFPLALLMIGSPDPAVIPRRRAILVMTVCAISLALQIPWVAHALVVTPLAGKPWLP
ncbi:MAG: hypothetical protein H7270_12735 [Dermatophilaceae bacterium]|nr:hypothetical protein [Dermatophilaceae bacterium]